MPLIPLTSMVSLVRTLSMSMVILILNGFNISSSVINIQHRVMINRTVLFVLWHGSKCIKNMVCCSCNFILLFKNNGRWCIRSMPLMSLRWEHESQCS